MVEAVKGSDERYGVPSSASLPSITTATTRRRALSVCHERLEGRSRHAQGPLTSFSSGLLKAEVWCPAQPRQA